MHICDVCALLVYAVLTEGNYTNQDISQASLNKCNIPLTLLSEVHTWGSSNNFPLMSFSPSNGSIFPASLLQGGGGETAWRYTAAEMGALASALSTSSSWGSTDLIPSGKRACLHLPHTHSLSLSLAMLHSSRFCHPEEGLRVWWWLTARVPLFFSAFHVHSTVASSWQPSLPSNLWYIQLKFLSACFVWVLAPPLGRRW